jgi:hypothetical protein
MRAVVQTVDLFDPFDQISHWVGTDAAEDVHRLTFIDTPGLSTRGSAKDEVLRYVLAHKNLQILVELLRADELDLILHVVLCNSQSAFSEIWEPMREQCSDNELGDLAERLVLVLNGTNILLTNDDLKRLWSSPDAAALEGDHIATVLDDNILQKMSDRGTLRPARIVLVDSKRIVESFYQGRPYQDIYAEYRPHLERWGLPGQAGYSSLERLGILPTYADNVRALCDPNDCGQGFLIRQVIDLLRSKGPKFYVRKYVVRSKLLRATRDLRELLLSYYDNTGRLNCQSIRASVQACLAFLNRDDPECLERFCEQHIDPFLAGYDFTAPTAKPLEWAKEAYVKLCQRLYASITQVARPVQEVEEVFRKYVQRLMGIWQADWGYRKARIPAPTKQEPQAGELIRHCLRFHSREMLHQLLIRNPDEQGLENLVQNEQDQKEIKAALDKLDQAHRHAEALCRQFEVPIP